MGFFDYVHVSDDRFVCSEGHPLSGEEFQSKDFGCVMGSVGITDGVLSFHAGCIDEEPSPDSNEAEVYCDCKQCPAFVQDGTGNLVACWVEFRIKIEGNRVVSVERTSKPTAEWLTHEPAQDHMKDCEGPMTYAEAYDLHVQYDDLRPERRRLKHERWKQWRIEQGLGVPPGREER